MSPRLRTAARVGAFAALALLLTGCIKLNMNLGINDNNTVSGTIQFGVQKELLELTGQSAEDLLGGETPFPSNAPGVTVNEFDDGEFVGQEFTFESVPLEEFNSGNLAGVSGVTGATAATGATGATAAGDQLRITREGDTFVVTGVLDLSSGLSGATGAFGATGQQFLESADIRLSFTFPGAVIDANGQVDGNTVTYTPTFGERVEISATGSAVDNGQAADVTGGDDDSNLMLILIIAGAVILLAIVIFLIVRSRRPKGGGTPQTGFGETVPAAAPSAPASSAPTAPIPPTAPTTPTDAPPPAPPPPPPAPPPPAEG